MCQENSHSSTESTSEFAKCSRTVFELAENDILEHKLEDDEDPAISTL